MDNNDIDYILEALDPAFEGIRVAIDQTEGLKMHFSNGDINGPTMDHAIVESMNADLVAVQNLMLSFIDELNARRD